MMADRPSSPPAPCWAGCRSTVAFSAPVLWLRRPMDRSRRSELHTFNNYYGLFVTDTLDITPRLSGTVSARFNSAQITLHDQIGTDLNGSHSYNRLNPAVGPHLQDSPEPDRLCRLCRDQPRADTGRTVLCRSASAMQPDQLLRRRPEPQTGGCAHVRGRPARDPEYSTTVRSWIGTSACSAPTAMTTSCSLSSETVGRAFFRNVGTTRRQGVEAGLRFRTGRLNAYANYAFTDATFQTALDAEQPGQSARRRERQYSSAARQPAAGRAAASVQGGRRLRHHRELDRWILRPRRKRQVPVRR